MGSDVTERMTRIDCMSGTPFLSATIATCQPRLQRQPTGTRVRAKLQTARGSRGHGCLGWTEKP
eukprot:8355571-Pyramimonas_sp.AAC.1